MWAERINGQSRIQSGHQEAAGWCVQTHCSGQTRTGMAPGLPLATSTRSPVRSRQCDSVSVESAKEVTELSRGLETVL